MFIITPTQHNEQTTQGEQTMPTLNDLTDHPEYKRIIADSYGGVIYDLANRDKYDSATLLAIWESLSDQQRNSANGIIEGAIRFIQGDE